MGFAKHLGIRIRLLPGIRALRLLRSHHFGRSAEERESARLQRIRPENLFQPSGFTVPNRYPHILREVKALVQDAPRPLRLLSFGCSTGEELLTLDSHFPGSLMTGIDISAPRLAIAAERLSSLRQQGRLQLFQGASADCLPPDLPPFDIVLAMSVFRHHDLEAAPARCSHRLRFADFEKTVTGLAGRVRPGGFLCMTNNHLDFTETAVAAGFERCVAVRHDPRNPLYGADDRLKPQPERDAVVFRRKERTDPVSAGPAVADHRRDISSGGITSGPTGQT